MALNSRANRLISPRFEVLSPRRGILGTMQPAAPGPAVPLQGPGLRLRCRRLRALGSLSRRRLTAVVAALLLAGALVSCDDAPDDPQQSSADSQEPVVIDIRIADGEVTPAGEQVDVAVGQEIRVRVDSDATDGLHVHSVPEHEYEIEAANNQVFTFSIDEPGQVEVETHETETVVAEIVVS